MDISTATLDLEHTSDSDKPTYIPGLDGVRGIAALMIMFLHLVPNYNSPAHPFLSILRKLAIIGQCGVPLFFVLSGFLITRILLHAKNHPSYFKQFYLKRVLRIFPLYYLYLVINFFLIPWLTGQPIPDLNLTWYYYLYLQNIAMTFNWKMLDLPHLWSLAVEEHFYFIWPFVIYFFSNKSTLKIIAGIIVFAFLCRVYLVSIGIGTYYFTLTTFDSLAIGAFLAFNEKRSWLNAKNMLQIAVVLVIPLIAIFPFITGSGSNVVTYFKNPVISVFCMSLIGLVSMNNHFLNRIFTAKFLKYTGRISYGLYVFHPTCYDFVNKYLPNTNFVLLFIMCFAASYLVATLSYYLFEMRFLRLKRKVAQ
jgi:peptidoglycan/LPS O-acetylase OafA/YrhL